MRTLLKACLDTTAGNKAIQNGTINKVLGQTVERIHPEASFFATENGKRTAFFVFDLKEVSNIPAIAEPFFIELGAEVTFTPCMNADELQKGIQTWQANK